nr:LOW QUALITY PROTEIN: uncharacterized protein LOC129279833 [Lytechinus pictus]
MSEQFCNVCLFAENPPTWKCHDCKPRQGKDLLPCKYSWNGPADSDPEHTYAHTDLLHASTIHILVPTPSFESQSTSQVDMDDNNQSKDLRARSPTKAPTKGSMRNGGKPRDGAGKMQKTFKQITNVRVSFFGSTLEKDDVLQKEQNKSLKEKKNPCLDGKTTAGAREVNVVDMTNNFTGKNHNYHGYHVEETPITTDDEASETRTKSADPGKDKAKDVRLCIAHREFLQEGQLPPNGRPAATPYSMPRSREADNELVLSTKLYPPAQESNEHTANSEDVTSPTPLSSKKDSCRYISSSKKKERSTVDSSSAGSSSHALSPRSLLHPSIASIHGKKETAAILSNFLRCSEDNGGPYMRVSKNGSPLKANIQGKKKKGEKDTTAVSCKSPEQQVCRRTTVQLTDREVRGQKFKMYDEVPQKALQKRPIRRTPDNSPRHSANIQYRGYRSARVSAHVLPAEGAPSKFIQKFGANRMMQRGKDGHRYCRAPKFGLHGNGSFTGQSPSPNRMRSATATAARSTSPLRRVVDISEQAMNSLVNEAIREKKSNQEDSGGDIVKSVQRHFNQRRKAQRRSPAYEMYTRFIPIQICTETGKEKGMIRPNSSPVPRLNSPKETVFNIMETLPSHPFPTPPPPSSISAPPPPVDQPDSPLRAGRVTMPTGISKRNAMSATDASDATRGKVEEWDATYRLERKISDTVKGATYVRNIRNQQRTQAWVADLASEFSPRMVAHQ